MEQIFTKIKYPPLLGYNLRFSKAFSKILNSIKIGKLGTILSVHCVCGQNLNQWRSNRELVNTPSASRSKGGGVLRELSHELDYLYKFFGMPHSVSGITSRQFFKNLDVEDTAMFHLKYNYNKNDILVSLNLDFIRHDPTRTCHIIGSKGTLVWDLLLGSVKFISADGAISKLYEDLNDLQQTNIWMWNSFLNDDTSLFCTLSEGVGHLEVIEKMEKNYEYE
jgi:predicted dehydrogenase